MKTDAERMALIRQRTAQLQRQARARQMLLIDAGCMAACLALVVCLGLAMPGWAGTSVALHVSPTGTAGMLSERGADGLYPGGRTLVPAGLLRDHPALPPAPQQ